MQRMLGRLLGFALGALVTEKILLHAIQAYAVGYDGSEPLDRILVVLGGIVLLAAMMAVLRRFMASSFYHGFVVATGLFLSFDIVVFHWIFRLHRITSGPEADVIEPILVIAGTIMCLYGFRKELAAKRSAPRVPRDTVHRL